MDHGSLSHNTDKHSEKKFIEANLTTPITFRKKLIGQTSAQRSQEFEVMCVVASICKCDTDL